MEDDGLGDHRSHRRTGDPHQYAYVNGNGRGGTARDSNLIEDSDAVHISHRISGINFTPTLHDSLVNEIRKLRNKLDKRENEVRLLNEELDQLRESHDNLQEANDLLASSSSKDIRSLRAQLERNAAVHVSEVKTLRNELQETTSAVHDLRSKLDSARRAKSNAEEQRDKWKSELDDLKTHSTQFKADIERRLVRETEKAKVLEDLVSKMEAEIERSTMSVKSGSDRMSVDIPHETEDEDDDDSSSPSAKHVQPGSPIQTLFAEMASMDNIDIESDDEMEDLPPGHYSSPQSPESSVSLPSISVATVLQSLRYEQEEEEDIETFDRGVQTETPHTVPMIRVLSPTPPLTNAPLMVPADDTETVDQCTQTTSISTATQSTQTVAVTPPRPKVQSPLTSPTLKSPILRPQNSIRRGSHTVRWQEDKSIQVAPEVVESAEIAIQTDPFILARALKPVLKSPLSETKEPDKDTLVRHERLKSYDGPSRRDSGGGIAKVGPTRRFEGGNRGSMHFEQGSSSGAVSHVNGPSRHEKRISGSHNAVLHSTHGRKVSGSQSHNDLRRGRQPHPSWMKARQQSGSDKRTPPPMQLHTPAGFSTPPNVQPPPLPIPQRTSSKYRVVLPIVRDRAVKEETLAEVAEVAEEADDDSIDEEERTRREVAAFLARPPRKTVRQIRSAVTLRPDSSNDMNPPPTPDRYHGEPSLTSSQTPSQSPLELAPKSYSTPRRQPKRLVKLKPPTQETPATNLSPASSYFPTSEEMTVVDEIARCMVGEYMYKYVRRRRRGSFTWRRSPARSPSNLTEEVDDSTIRHKRWVWLQPYEKMIMWSSTQPSQSNFLQRTQVKKRVVTNVLDVRDDTPLLTSPSSSHLPTPAHNRSIVVLTPTQAIKFTALTRERHISWLTALSFLVHNDPADLMIPRSVSASPSQGSLWAREPVYPASATASSIASSHGTQQHPFQVMQQHAYHPVPHNTQGIIQPPSQAIFGTYTVRKNSLPDFAQSRLPSRDEGSPLGYKQRLEVEYALPPSVPRIPTGRRFEGRERSGSGSAARNWDDREELPWNGNGETIRMDAFVKSTPPRVELDIDDNLFREF